MKDEKPQPELINVHQVYADKDMLIFLRMTDQQFVEGLFYRARHIGRANFEHLGQTYLLLRNKDGSYSVKVDEEQNFTTESFS